MLVSPDIKLADHGRRNAVNVVIAKEKARKRVIDEIRLDVGLVHERRPQTLELA